MQEQIVRIGLAGLGTVGGGLAEILRNNAEWIQKRIGKRIQIAKVLVRDLDKDRDVPPPPEAELTNSIEGLVRDPDLDIVVELIGGEEAAYRLISMALEEGKSVVTANKALLAEHGPELFQLAAERGAGLAFEASVAGGVPIVKTLKDSLAGNRIKSLTGILNGTDNYILSEMTSRGISFQEALEKAQELGYAEADPSLDVDGYDAAHKLTVLIRLASGKDYPYAELPVHGIRGIEAYDIDWAKAFGYQIKLIAQVKDRSGSLQAGVFPALIPEEDMLAKVDGPFNAVLLEGDAVGPIMLYGQGAGDLPTGSAVLSDIMDLAGSCSGASNSGFVNSAMERADILPAELTVCRHYFRFTVQDRPGVLSVLSGIMGEHNISIAQVVQKQEQNGEAVPVVFLTHAAQLKDVHNALAEIDKLSFIKARTRHHRIL
ncbi:MAG: homoserine dehydrogenase [Desulfohalobiaceae bacterium]|nr:homoserine dehydrogenase [Desulfohalobiaceae bacterium]